MEPRKVEFELTKADLLLGIWHVFPRMLFVRVQILFVALGILIVMLYRSPPESLGAIGSLVILILAVCLGMFLGLVALNIAFSFLMAGNGRGVYDCHRIHIDEVGVHESTDYGESVRKWIVIPFIAASRKYIFIQAGSMQLHIIPKRAFPDDAAAAAFWTELDTLWKAGRAQGQPPGARDN